MQALSKICQHCHKSMNGGLYRASHVCPHCSFEHEGGKNSYKRSTINTLASNNTQALNQTYSTETLTDSNHSLTQEPQRNDYPKNLAGASKNASEAPAPSELKTQQSAPKVNADAEVQNVSEPNASKTKASVQDTPQNTLNKSKSRKSVNSKVTLTAEPSHEQMVIRLFDEISATSTLHIELTPDLFINGKFAGTKSPKIQAALKQGKKDVLGQIQKSAFDLGANTVADIEIKNGMKMMDKKSAKITVTANGTALLTETSATAVNA